MAFAITKFKAGGLRIEGATRQHVLQVVEMNGTAANTDTAYDILTAAGTFWTSALADATYGSLATQAKYVILTSIAGILSSFENLEGETAANYLKVLTLSAGNQYTLTTTNSMPSIAFNSGSAPTAFKFVFKWILQDGIEAIVSDLGTTL